MIDFRTNVVSYFELVRKNEIEIYNEISLQLELGVYLRTVLGKSFKVEFERPSDHFDSSALNLEKKEIDLVVSAKDGSEKYAFEFKYPRHGQYPERMFKACQDICFLEQLCRFGFSRGYFVMVADDSLFFNLNQNATGIYSHFRAGTPIHGHINKPTGKDKGRIGVNIDGIYSIIWNFIDEKRRYTLVEVSTNSP